MGRELDKAIAEALGKKSNTKPSGMLVRYGCGKSKDGMFQLYEEAPHYSTDGNAMLEIDKEMRERSQQLMVEVCNDGYAAAYWCIYQETWTDDCIADTMPEAVALAAYKALTGKGWQECDFRK